MLAPAFKTRMFFDSALVQRRVDQSRVRVMSKQGAFVRRAARSSIRKRKAPAPAGSPPSSHTGLLRDRIFFAYDPSSDNVIIGPEKTNQVFFGHDGEPVNGTVPEALEIGGQVRILEVRRRGRWSRADLRSRRRLAGQQTRLRTVKIDARPYMGPALKSGMADYERKWRNSLR